MDFLNELKDKLRFTGGREFQIRTMRLKYKLCWSIHRPAKLVFCNYTLLVILEIIWESTSSPSADDAKCFRSISCNRGTHLWQHAIKTPFYTLSLLILSYFITTNSFYVKITISFNICFSSAKTVPDFHTTTKQTSLFTVVTVQSTNCRVCGLWSATDFHARLWRA